MYHFIRLTTVSGHDMPRTPILDLSECKAEAERLMKHNGASKAEIFEHNPDNHSDGCVCYTTDGRNWQDSVRSTSAG